MGLIEISDFEAHLLADRCVGDGIFTYVQGFSRARINWSHGGNDAEAVSALQTAASNFTAQNDAMATAFKKGDNLR